MTIKESLRRELTTRLSNLSDREYKTACDIITAKLWKHIDWQSITNACFYQANQDWKEVPLSSLAQRLAATHSSLTITYTETSPEAMLPETGFDIVLVPLLGFDAAFNRLGRGQGWYDRFLVTQPNATKIGVGLSVQRVPSIPNEQHDQTLDKIITDSTH